MSKGGSLVAGARRLVAVSTVAGGLLLSLHLGTPHPVFADDPEEPKSNRMVCGSCPEGYVTTGVTSAPSVCKDGDPTLVQCVPPGAKLLAVCGDCPEGYSTIGTSIVPSRCGGIDNGRMSQCQREGEGEE